MPPFGLHTTVRSAALHIMLDALRRSEPPTYFFFLLGRESYSLLAVQNPMSLFFIHEAINRVAVHVPYIYPTLLVLRLCDFLMSDVCVVE